MVVIGPRATVEAPVGPRGNETTLPPPSLRQTTSGSSTVRRYPRSPRSGAFAKVPTSLSCLSWDGVKRGRPLARCAVWHEMRVCALRQACGRRRILDPLEPQPRLLYTVLRFGERAGDRVGDPQQSGTLAFKLLREIAFPPVLISTRLTMPVEQNDLPLVHQQLAFRVHRFFQPS